MNTIEISGLNRYEKHSRVREACRGIIIDGENILLVFEIHTDQWFIPGGGVEGRETLGECCARELAEETGISVIPEERFLTINEYYKDWLFITHYFVCRATGATERDLSEREASVGLEPRWISLDEAIKIYSKHREYATVNEMKRGLYLREYKALLAYKEFCKK